MRADEVSLSTTGRFVGKDQLVAPPKEHVAGLSRRILIVGGGASGTLLAIRLLREPDTEVILIERSGHFGRGLAYSAPSEAHVLNVPPMRLSAFEDQPDHFWTWLVAEGRVGEGEDRFVFLPRRWYGDYLEATLAAAAAGRAGRGRLVLIRDEVMRLSPAGGDAVVAELASGQHVTADICVLATGHDGRPSLQSRENDPALPLLILGTGLSMIDQFLAHAGGGPVIAISRHGLLPRPHAAAGSRLPSSAIPLGSEVSLLLRWIRQQVEVSKDWRAVMDGLRPFAQEIWRAWTDTQRARFLRHARSYWDVHRHRAPPRVFGQVQAAIANGELESIAATVTNARPGAGRQTVAIRRRGSSDVETLEVRDVVDCRGMVRDWDARPDSLVYRLVRDGTARFDRLRLGIDVTAEAELVGANGTVHHRLFAIGPLGRGALFEIEAIPEIRAQCDRVAITLARRAAAAREPYQAELGDAAAPIRYFRG